MTWGKPRRDPDAWISKPQPTHELCRLFHGIDCRRGCSKEDKMEHEPFPVAGFEFMNEPATTEQKEIIVGLAAKCGTPIDPDGQWPEPFSKHDAYRMIKALRAKLGLPGEA